ncbi:Gp37-like protein [Alloscardovia sp. HMSC034E08]|uniref:Gp37-like protein n=1 Tax=Alloscardovia sp. HMSC034E08 TaxID=1739413 RepID=UPI0008AEB058|nr:hypothetical protein [Alloscardovia sp. HMSC034E08]OFR01160.1 hypothetical protein HMPREF2909_00085 [Alloscardovia sp. HMSC034E08]
MGLKLHILNSDGYTIAILQHYSLDLAYGVEENNFELSYTDELPSDVRISNGCMWMIPDSEYGGIIDTIEDDNGSITFQGRSWQGVLERKILEPTAGQDYLRVQGSLSTVLADLVARCHLSTLIEADSELVSVTVSYQFNRYVSLYSGLRSLFNAYQMTVVVYWDLSKNKLVLSARRQNKLTRASEQVDLKATRVYRPVNHLIGLGQGELRNRATSHWYADRQGNVSQSQTLTGVDEVEEIYDYSSEDNAKLADDTRKKLLEYQNESKAELTLNDPTDDLYVGDIVSAYSPVTGLSLTNPVGKKVVTIDDGVLSVDYTLTSKITVTNY